MPATTAPNTKAIGNAIVGFLAALTYPDTTAVYSYTQLETINDVATRVSDGGVIAEVLASGDSSKRRGFGGRMWDIQKWFILSMCSLETPVLSAKIYDARDALVQPFQAHAQLNNVVSNLFHSELLDTMQFLRAPRNGQFFRAHLAILETRQEWIVPTPPGVVS
jgi:hypothetical protein